MKKARLILAAVLVMAIAGGVVAAKAKRGAALFCATTYGTTILPYYTLPNYTITTLTARYYLDCTASPLSTITKPTYVTFQP